MIIYNAFMQDNTFVQHDISSDSFQEKYPFFFFLYVKAFEMNVYDVTEDLFRWWPTFQQNNYDLGMSLCYPLVII